MSPQAGWHTSRKLGRSRPTGNWPGKVSFQNYLLIRYNKSLLFHLSYFNDVGEQVDGPRGEGVEEVDGADRGDGRPQRPPLGAVPLEVVEVELGEGDDEERRDEAEAVELRRGHRVGLGGKVQIIYLIPFDF